MILQFLNGDQVDTGSGEETNLKTWLTEHHITPSGFSPRFYTVDRENRENRILHVVFVPRRVSIGRQPLPKNLLFLNTCRNESILRLAIVRIHEQMFLVENPHPLVVEEILVKWKHLTRVEDIFQNLCANPDDRIVDRLLTECDDRISAYDFARNPNPRAQDWVIANFYRLSLNGVILVEMFRHPYEPSIHFVWKHLYDTGAYQDLARLPPNHHPVAVAYRHSFGLSEEREEEREEERKEESEEEREDIPTDPTDRVSILRALSAVTDVEVICGE